MVSYWEQAGVKLSDSSELLGQFYMGVGVVKMSLLWKKAPSFPLVLRFDREMLRFIPEVYPMDGSLAGTSVICLPGLKF